MHPSAGSTHQPTAGTTDCLSRAGSRESDRRRTDSRSPHPRCERAICSPRCVAIAMPWPRSRPHSRAVQQTRPRHLIAREADSAAPRVVDGDLRQLRKDALEVAAQDRRGASSRALVRRRELGAATEEEPVVSGQPEVMEKMLRVERGAPPRQKRRGCIARQRRGHDDVAADRNVAALQRRCRAIRGRHRSRTARRAWRPRPPTSSPPIRSTRAARRSRRAPVANAAPAPVAAAASPSDIPRWLQCATSLVDEQAVVGVAANFGPLLGPRHELDAMAEHARQECLLGLGDRRSAGRPTPPGCAQRARTDTRSARPR